MVLIPAELKEAGLLCSAWPQLSLWDLSQAFQLQLPPPGTPSLGLQQLVTALTDQGVPSEPVTAWMAEPLPRLPQHPGGHQASAFQNKRQPLGAL